jgi:hypothetical protein
VPPPSYSPPGKTSPSGVSPVVPPTVPPTVPPPSYSPPGKTSPSGVSPIPVPVAPPGYTPSRVPPSYAPNRALIEEVASEKRFFPRLFSDLIPLPLKSTLLAGESGCMEKTGGSKCFGQSAKEASWEVSMDSEYDISTATTRYTFVLESRSSGCGTPDSLTLRVRDGAPVSSVTPAPSTSSLVETGCNGAGLRNTIRWDHFDVMNSSNGVETATFQVEVSGEVADLCAAGINIVDASGRTVAKTGDEGCTFLISSSSCCRHGLTEAAPQF